MKYVTRILCAFSTAIFLASCAGPGSGCYDFGYEIKSDENTQHIVFTNVELKENMDITLTNCAE